MDKIKVTKKILIKIMYSTAKEALITKEKHGYYDFLTRKYRLA